MGTWWALAGLCIATAGFYGTKGPFWSMPSMMLTGTAAAAGIAWINSVGNAGGFFGPAIVGWLKDVTGSYAGGLYGLALFTLVSAITAAFGLHIPRRVARVTEVPAAAGVTTRITARLSCRWRSARPPARRPYPQRPADPWLAPTLSAPDWPACLPRSPSPRPGARSRCMRLRPWPAAAAARYFDRELGLTIDNGNHLLLSGNRAAFAYLKAIGATGKLGGPAKARFPFMDLSTGLRWTVRPNAGPIPWWLLLRSRRVPQARLGDYLRAAGADPADRRHHRRDGAASWLAVLAPGRASGDRRAQHAAARGAGPLARRRAARDPDAGRRRPASRASRAPACPMR